MSSSESASGNPSVRRNAGSFSLSRSNAVKCSRRAASLSNWWPRHSTGPDAGAGVERLSFFCVCLVTASPRLLDHDADLRGVLALVQLGHVGFEPLTNLSHGAGDAATQKRRM